MSNCMFDTLFNSNSFTCNNCPIKKYNCCGTTDRDYYELLSRLQIDIVRLEAIRQRVLDELN